MSNYLSSFNALTQRTTAANGTNNLISSTDDSNGSIMNNDSTNATANTVVSDSDLSDDDIELLKKELQRKIEKLKSELEEKQNTESFIGNIGNSIAQIFGGNKNISKQISEYETLLNDVDNGTTDIVDAYETITGFVLDTNSLTSLKQSKAVETNLTTEEQQEIVLQLESQLEELENNFNTIKSQNGLIGKVWDGIKNLTGIGAGSNKTQA